MLICLLSRFKAGPRFDEESTLLPSLRAVTDGVAPDGPVHPSMPLRHMLGRIQAYSDNLGYGRLPSFETLTAYSGTFDAVGGRPH